MTSIFEEWKRPGIMYYNFAQQSSMWLPVAVSAILNFVLILIFGRIFQKVATIMNDLENHRLEAAHERSMIYKNFVFQFINNFFVMFYIAYLRQLQFPQEVFGFPEWFPKIGSPVHCRVSCLGALQMKLLIVFVGKTWALKFVEYGKPLLTNFNRLRKHVQKGNPRPVQTVASKLKNTQQNEQQYRESVRQLTVEEQGQLEEFDGTFEDFQQMVVQVCSHNLCMHYVRFRCVRII